MLPYNQEFAYAGVPNFPVIQKTQSRHSGDFHYSQKKSSDGDGSFHQNNNNDVSDLAMGGFSTTQLDDKCKFLDQLILYRLYDISL